MRTLARNGLNDFTKDYDLFCSFNFQWFKIFKKISFEGRVYCAIYSFQNCLLLLGTTVKSLNTTAAPSKFSYS